MLRFLLVLSLLASLNLVLWGCKRQKAPPVQVVKWVFRNSVGSSWSGKQTRDPQGVQHILSGIKRSLTRPLTGSKRPKKGALPFLSHLIVVEEQDGSPGLRLEVFGNTYVKKGESLFFARELLIVLGLMGHRGVFLPLPEKEIQRLTSNLPSPLPR